MIQLELIPENSVEIIQRAYTYLSEQYDHSDRCIVDYTYSFSYRSFCGRDKKSQDLIRYIKKDNKSSYKTVLRGFLFVDVAPNQHYFFLPEECLIIECNNGKFGVLDFLGQDDDKTQYPKIINLMLSYLESSEFVKFTNFNKFYNRDFSINDFCSKLKIKKRVTVKELISRINGYLDSYIDELYNSIFQDWLKYFLNVDLACKKQYCAEISKEIDIDLSNKKDFYVLQLGFYPTQTHYNTNANLQSQSGQLEDKLRSAFKDIFLDFAKIEIANPLSYFNTHSLTYLKNVGQRDFFIPAKSSTGSNWNTVSYFIFFQIGKHFMMREEKYNLNIGDFLKHIELDNSVLNPNSRNVYNDIFTSANIQKDDYLYKLQNYFFAVSFGYNETKQLIHKYAFYNHERAKELIDKFEYQDVFKISEDAFLLRMKEIYKLLQNVKQLQGLDYEHHVQELNDYIIKNELDNENVVI